MKPVWDVRVGKASERLPRFANRGLIEARAASRKCSASEWHFPDSRIGASLKRLGLFILIVAGITSPIRESGPH